MKEIVLAVAALLASQAPMSGLATYYAPNLMERVLEYRLSVGDVEPCPECVGYVALLSPDHIGKSVWVQHPDGRMTGKLQVIDCAQANHAEALLMRGWVVDLSWPLAQEWNLRGPLENVKVYFREPE